MNRKLFIALAMFMLCGLSGCGKTDVLNQYDTAGLEYIAWSDIDTVCEDQELVSEGESLLSSMSENIMLSYVVDSAIELTVELGEYDHLVMTNPQWIHRFADPNKLRPVEYSSLSDSMQKFLELQMPLLTVDGSILPDGVGLYEYDADKLFSFPVNVVHGGVRPVEAQNPLIILVDKPEVILNAGSCMLPLTSSGNVLFSESESLQSVFEMSELSNYAEIHILGNV